MLKIPVAALGFTLLTMVTSPVTWAANVDVYANANSSSGGSGADTGLLLNIGDVFTVSAHPDDLWSAGAVPRWSNGNGLVGNLYASGTDESGLPSGSLIGQDYGLWQQNGLLAPYGSLVGEIGGVYALLGTSFQGAAWGDGILRLYYWDSNASDNSEFISVTAMPSAVPVPSAVLLLGAALAGLAGIARRRHR